MFSLTVATYTVMSEPLLFANTMAQLFKTNNVIKS